MPKLRWDRSKLRYVPVAEQKERMVQKTGCDGKYDDADYWEKKRREYQHSQTHYAQRAANDKTPENIRQHVKGTRRKATNKRIETMGASLIDDLLPRVQQVKKGRKARGE